MRALYPAKHLTPSQIDSMRETAERAAIVECARRTGKSESELVARCGLPDTDFNAGAVAYDQWLTAALVAGTEYNFITQQLRTDQVVVVYGVATLDANPGIGRVRALSGGATVLAAWDTTPLWAAEDTIGYTDEFALFSVTETVNIWLLPFITKPGGERFIILTVVAEPKGIGPITK